MTRPVLTVKIIKVQKVIKGQVVNWHSRFDLYAWPGFDSPIIIVFAKACVIAGNSSG